MSLIWTGRPIDRPCYFEPDRIGNFRHDAPDDFNMTVYTADGLAICGRVVENAKGRWIHVLRPEWR